MINFGERLCNCISMHGRHLSDILFHKYLFFSYSIKKTLNVQQIIIYFILLPLKLKSWSNFWILSFYLRHILNSKNWGKGSNTTLGNMSIEYSIYFRFYIDDTIIISKVNIMKALQYLLLNYVSRLSTNTIIYIYKIYIQAAISYSE